MGKGSRLKVEMVRRGIKEKELAAELNVKVPTLSPYVREEVLPSPEFAKEIADAMARLSKKRCSVSELFAEFGKGTGRAEPMMSIDAGLVRARMKEKGVTAIWLAEQLGVTKQAVSSWLTKSTDLRARYALGLCEHLKLDPAKAIRHSSVPAQIDSITTPAFAEGSRRPLRPEDIADLSTDFVRELVAKPLYAVPAGLRREQFDDESLGDKYIPRVVMPGRTEKFRVLVAKGYSMGDPDRADIQDGDFVLMVESPEVWPNRIQVVSIFDEVTLKRIRKRKDGYYAVPEPAHHEIHIPEVRLPEEGTRFLGYVDSVMRVRKVSHR